MTDKHRISFTKLERSQKRAAERILADPSALPSHKATALRTLKRVQTAAEDRAFDRALADEPDEPTVDDLVKALENPPKTTIPEAQNCQNAVLEPPSSVNALEVTQTAPEPTTAFCGFCSAAGQWNTVSGGVILCPTCFAKVCATEMRTASAASLARQSSWLYEKGTDPNVNDLSDLRGMSRDYQSSVRIWEQEARDDADRQELQARERAAAEDQFNRARADFIQRGGKL
jgi:hypothetical protein